MLRPSLRPDTPSPYLHLLDGRLTMCAHDLLALQAAVTEEVPGRRRHSVEVDLTKLVQVPAPTRRASVDAMAA